MDDSNARVFGLEAGIAIGPILFIIALLAILAAAIAAGSGSFTGGTGQETASTQASAILQYADVIKGGVQTVLMGNSCDPAKISFSNPISTSTNGGTDPYANSNAPSDGSCSVFAMNGGGVQFQEFPAPWYSVNCVNCGNTQSYIVGEVQGVGSGAPGILLWFRGIQKATCAEINKLLGITSSLPGRSFNSDGVTLFSGTFSGPINIASEFTGYPVGCYSNDGSSEYDFYEVVLTQ